MFLYGGGGIGVVALDVLLDGGASIDCVIDQATAGGSLLGVPVISSLEKAHERFGRQCSGLICIGDNAQRRELATVCAVDYLTAISRTAVVSDSASLGEGSMVFQNATVQARARIGRHLIANTAASIDHDCVIGDFVHVGPNSTLCGHVTLEDGVNVGAGAVFAPGVTVGRDAIIGAGTVVLGDVPARATAVGAPARVVRVR